MATSGQVKAGLLKSRTICKPDYSMWLIGYYTRVCLGRGNPITHAQINPQYYWLTSTLTFICLFYLIQGPDFDRINKTEGTHLPTLVTIMNYVSWVIQVIDIPHHFLHFQFLPPACNAGCSSNYGLSHQQCRNWVMHYFSCWEKVIRVLVETVEGIETGATEMFLASNWCNEHWN